MKTAIKDLLQKGDRITGKTASGTPHTGTFEGYNSKDLTLCNTGEKTIALNPATVERVAEPQWAPQYGDRVRGTNMDGNPDQGIITRVGSKYVILDNQQRRNLVVDSLELLQAQAAPEDLLYLVGLPWVEQVDQLFADRGIANLANYMAVKSSDLIFFESWRGWIISFNGGTEVHLTKAGQQASWCFALSKHPKLKGNGDISKFCRTAIDAVEDTLAVVEAGTQSKGGTLTVPEPELDDIIEEEEAVAIACGAITQRELDDAHTLETEILKLYAELDEAEATAISAGKAALSLYLALGSRLTEQKDALPHGHWLPWLQEHNIQERKAQRAIQLHGKRDVLGKGDSATALTLTEALALVGSKKAIKTATPDPIPAENIPIPANSANPEAEAPDQLADVIETRTEPLAVKNGGSIGMDGYDYIEITPQAAWFDPGNGMVEGEAIAKNGRGFVRINWGEGRQGDIPESRVSWVEPTTTAVTAEIEAGLTAEIEAGLTAIGLDVCKPSITPAEFNREMWGTENPTLQTVQANGLVENRPCGSQWLPEEIERYARIQLQGLLKHLEPSELVKAAIVHSGVSVVDVVRVAVEMANKKEFEAICDLLIEEGS